jgi:hypothetical protein
MDCLTETKLIQHIEPSQSTAEESFPECAKGCDVVLLVHVVYLMRNGSLRNLLRTSPLGTPMYIILDAPGSVFTDLWRNTAPKYYARALKAHETIQALSKDDWVVSQNSIMSRIRTPIHIDRPDLRTAIFSMLCYADLSKDLTGSIESGVADTLNAHTVGNFVLCESTCYEIKRVGGGC